jgi:hypothetical protein
MEQCRGCGRGPATKLVIRRHVGMLVFQRFVTLRTTLCRECGIKVTKDYTGRTLVQGWWGIISFFVNWFCLAGNLVAYRKASKLAQPSAFEYVPAEREAA